MLMMLVKSRDAGGLMLMMLASGLGRAADAHDACEESRRTRAG